MGDGGAVYLNAGSYGGLTEFRDLDTSGRFNCLSTEGQPRVGDQVRRTGSGPTCVGRARRDKTPAGWGGDKESYLRRRLDGHGSVPSSS